MRIDLKTVISISVTKNALYAPWKRMNYRKIEKMEKNRGKQWKILWLIYI